MSPVGVGLITDVKGPITATTVIGLINKGDASIQAAKSAAGINGVATADYHTKGFYPFFAAPAAVTGS